MQNFTTQFNQASDGKDPIHYCQYLTALKARLCSFTEINNIITARISENVMHGTARY